MIRPSTATDDHVVLVDCNDAPLGVAPKLDVHRDGRLHRAVSVVLFDISGRLLLQRRAAAKYHSAGLWSNTCCGHPRPDEPVVDAARRRLSAEMGITGVDLVPAGHLLYCVAVSDGLIEYELDHVVVGTWSGTPKPDAAEVSAWRWVSLGILKSDVARRPDRYTPWLSHLLAYVEVPGLAFAFPASDGRA